MKPLLPLSELIPGWPPDAPQSLTEVWNAEPDGFDDRVKELRRHLVDVRNSFDSAPVRSPEDVAVLLERRLLRPLPGVWLTVPLDGSRRRILAPVPTGETVAAVMDVSRRGDERAVRRTLTVPGAARWVWAAHVSRRVPTAAVLDEHVPVDPTGGYLLVYGGSPTVLDTDGVADALAETIAAAPVVDVVFWQLQPQTAPTCFSLGAGRGDRAGEAVPFPCNTEIATRLSAALRKEEAR